MMEVGRLCTKIAGRDAGKKCVIVEVLDDTFVIIDGETRRRKCNLKHIDPSKELLKISKGADHNMVKAEFKKLGIDLIDAKPKQTTQKKIQIRSAERKKMAAKEDSKVKTETKNKPVPVSKTESTEVKPVEKTKLEKAVSEEK